MGVTPSLFDVAATSVLAAAADWATGTLLGDIANTLCILAVGFIGVMLITGRLAVRESIRVVIGCFVLLGAPVIASGLRDLAHTSDSTSAISHQPNAMTPPLPALPPADYDPYAGASLRQD